MLDLSEFGKIFGATKVIAFPLFPAFQSDRSGGHSINILRHIIINDHVDVFDINTPCCNIGRNKDLDVPFLNPPITRSRCDWFKVPMKFLSAVSTCLYLSGKLFCPTLVLQKMIRRCGSAISISRQSTSSFRAL